MVGLCCRTWWIQSNTTSFPALTHGTDHAVYGLILLLLVFVTLQDRKPRLWVLSLAFRGGSRQGNDFVGWFLSLSSSGRCISGWTVIDRIVVVKLGKAIRGMLGKQMRTFRGQRREQPRVGSPSTTIGSSRLGQRILGKGRILFVGGNGALQRGFLIVGIVGIVICIVVGFFGSVIVVVFPIHGIKQTGGTLGFVFVVVLVVVILVAIGRHVQVCLRAIFLVVLGFGGTHRRMGSKTLVQNARGSSR